MYLILETINYYYYYYLVDTTAGHHQGGSYSCRSHLEYLPAILG